ncbi:MAG: beta-galactosidase [Candidatus Saccharimonadales bacterium]
MPQPKKNSKAKATKRPFYKRHWGSNEARQRTRLIHHLEKLRFEKPRFWFKERKLWQKIMIILSIIVILWVGAMYGIARWYIASHADQQTRLGTTFIPTYAEYYGLDAQETYKALIYDLGLRHFRLVSYWDKIEPTKGEYDFSQLDWQFKIAEQSGSKVSLAIGLRQPRWPECHMPIWAMNQPKAEWSADLKTFMGKVIERYKDSPALDSYQLENEFFLKAFGECSDFDRNRLVDEFNYVKQQDPNHKVIISRSNNALGLPVGKPTPDEFGISVYKRVWDKNITHRYFEYPFPAWFYGFLAGAGQILTGKDMIIHELQAESWLPEGYLMPTAPIEEQNKSLDAKRLHDRIEYGKATGMKTIDLWGAEWWYWRKTTLHDDSLWQVVKDEVQDTQRTNAYQ